MTIADRRNEALDGTIYAMAALQLLGGRVIQQPGAWAEKGIAARLNAPAVASAAPAPVRRMVSKGINW